MNNFIPPIKATNHMKKILSDYYFDLSITKNKKKTKIAWCTSVGPSEILLSMGFKIYYPENHGAILGAKRIATEVIPLANAAGYSPDICSYLTADIGAYLKKITPLTKLYGIKTIPKPDILVFNTNQCRDVVDWFSYYSRLWNVPIIGIYSHRGLNKVHQYQIDDIVKQFKALIPVLESISGNKFDISFLREIVNLSKECTLRWREVLEMSTHIPSPITFFDHIIHMAPAVILRGKQEAINYYDLLIKELKERIKNKITAISNEKHRLYWEGMPIWGGIRILSEIIKKNNAAIVASTYCNSWIFESFDPNEPLESMAKAYLELFITRDENYKERYIKNCIERYNIKGVIFHDAKTCPNNSNNRYAMPNRINNNLNIPTLTIYGDLNDLRCFSSEQTTTNIEAFIEQIEEIK